MCYPNFEQKYDRLQRLHKPILLCTRLRPVPIFVLLSACALCRKTTIAPASACIASGAKIRYPIDIMYSANSMTRMLHNIERLGALNSAADSSRKMMPNRGNSGECVKIKTTISRRPLSATAHFDAFSCDDLSRFKLRVFDISSIVTSMLLVPTSFPTS